MWRQKSGWFALVLGGAMAGLLTAVAVLPFGLVAGLGVRAALPAFDGLPADLATPRTPQTSYLYAADGTLMTTFADEDRTDVPLSAIAPVMRDAIVAAEDARFYQHGAVDPRGIVRALVADTGSGSAEQGASTLTMQYVRNVLKTAPGASGSQQAAATADTVTRKLQEVRYAAALEHRLSKDEILDRYLNIVYFGAGAYGVAAAARTYFSTTPARLTAAQATLLAGLVQAPDRYDPIDGDRSAALDRRAYVLSAMVRAGTMTSAEAARVTAAPVGLKPGPVAFRVRRGRGRGRTVRLRLPGLVVAAAVRVRRDTGPAADRAARRRVPDRGLDGRRGPGEGDRGGGRGVRAVAMAQRLGITFRAPSDAAMAAHSAATWGSFTLGVSDTTPLDLAGAYATIAADGLYCAALPVTSITGPDGTASPAATPACHQAVAPDIARAAVDAARCPVGQQGAYGSCDGATAAQVSDLLGGRPVGGKTGSSEGNATESFVGFTPQAAVAGIAANPLRPADGVGPPCRPR